MPYPHIFNLFNFISITQMSFERASYPFPPKLSRDFHGSTKPRERLASIHRQKFRQQTLHNKSQHNPQHHLYKVSDILNQSRRLDNDVIKQRNELITHSTRVSKQSPQWWKSTFNYFKQSQMDALSKSIKQQRMLQKGYDVFNRKRYSYMTIDNMRMDSIYNNKPAMVSRQSGRNSAISTNTQQNNINQISYKLGRSLNALRQVSPKVGSLDTRDNKIKKTLLKIGANNFVDTYSVF